MRSAQEIFRPYFCLIGQSNRRALVEVRIVRPTVERREALLPGSGAAGGHHRRGYVPAAYATPCG